MEHAPQLHTGDKTTHHNLRQNPVWNPFLQIIIEFRGGVLLNHPFMCTNRSTFYNLFIDTTALSNYYTAHQKPKKSLFFKKHSEKNSFFKIVLGCVYFELSLFEHGRRPRNAGEALPSSPASSS